MASEFVSVDDSIAGHAPSPDAQPQPEPKLGDSLKDIAFGSAAGMIGKVFEYPFDTVKVRLQSQADNAPLRYGGPIDCFIQGLQQDGFRGLYRGISSPMVGAAVENSSLFFSYNLIQRVVRKAFYPDLGKSEKLPMQSLLVCGAGSGAFTSVLLTPIELIKCKMQVQTIPHSRVPVAADMAKTSQPHPGPLKLIGQVYHSQGLKGFFHGGTGTFFRETGGSAAWFGSYEFVTSYLRKRRGGAPSTASDQMLAGAAAGVSYNFMLFPADTIKSRMQTSAITTTGLKSPGFWAIGRGMYTAGGIPALYRGCGITVVRSAPSSALIFLCYEQLKGWFS